VLGAASALLTADVASRCRRLRGARARPAALAARLRGGGRAATVVAVCASALVAPPIPVLVLVGWLAVRALRRRRERLGDHRAVRRALPEVVDLFALACTAGLTLPEAHPLVARRAPPPVGPALAAADAAASAGRPRADALVAHLAPLGERTHALALVLVDHLRYGAPLLPALERASFELRLDRRRAAEVEARRVPVRMLAPLVLCVLPAFALLTVVPLLAASLESLPT
jgi:Flp pilus assembly protein TadB